MPVVNLACGAAVTVDEEDVALVQGFMWKLDRYGYVSRSSTRCRPYLHRIIMNAPPRVIVDHINGEPLDNRRSNLRTVTAEQSSMNRGGTGITWHKQVKRWQAAIRVRGRSYHLGVYLTREEALAARSAGERILFGEYRRKKKESNSAATTGVTP